jgi:signal transduction protein with GAF and PtsI domain
MTAQDGGVPVDEVALTRSLERLTKGLTTPPSVDALTARLAVLVDTAREVLFVDAVGLLLLGDTGQLRTVATTGPASATLEEAQADLGIGPGLDVLHTRAPVAVTDLAAEPSYAPLWERVRDAGYRAVVSGPVWVGRQVVGNLNGMRPDVHEWSSSEVAAVEAFAGVIGTLLGLTARSTPRVVLDLAARSGQDGTGSPWSADSRGGDVDGDGGPR